MTAGTVVITGGILATIILLCIIAVLCYCRLQYYCCKKEESESEEEEPDFAVTSRLPQEHSNHNILAATVPTATTPNGPGLFTPPRARKLTRSQTYCPCTHYDLPFYLQQPEGLRNGGERISYRSVHQQYLGLPTPIPTPLPTPFPTQLPTPLPNYHKLNLSRSVTMREMFQRSCSISTEV
ncbi:protein FAM163B-like isoform X1 [Xyrauchen texanus]|uniref:protein FAM163B-like isoform X1 n=1 Tax=Xyrauchen texanus TaxID=154827 RepID=UPI0022428F9C|nr:protein FAM163B-like isoform X1 [Xyrauchen texanus]